MFLGETDDWPRDPQRCPTHEDAAPRQIGLAAPPAETLTEPSRLSKKSIGVLHCFGGRVRQCILKLDRDLFGAPKGLTGLLECLFSGSRGGIDGSTEGFTISGLALHERITKMGTSHSELCVFRLRSVDGLVGRITAGEPEVAGHKHRGDNPHDET